MNMSTNKKGNARRMGGLAVLAVTMSAAPSWANDPTPPVQAVAAVFNTASDMVSAAVQACGAKNQLPPISGGSDTLIPLPCPSNIKESLAPVSCEFNGTIKASASLAGAAQGKVAFSAKATTTSTSNDVLHHDHMPVCGTPNSPGCPQEYVKWQVLVNVDLKVTADIQTEYGVAKADMSGALGAWVKNWRYVEKVPHDTPADPQKRKCNYQAGAPVGRTWQNPPDGGTGSSTGGSSSGGSSGGVETPPPTQPRDMGLG
jgi:hypothetical protein